MTEAQQINRMINQVVKRETRTIKTILWGEVVKIRQKEWGTNKKGLRKMLVMLV